jgi:hypothetical protein
MSFLILKALERLHRRYPASFMPEKCRIFKLAVLVHVHAVANIKGLIFNSRSAQKPGPLFDQRVAVRHRSYRNVRIERELLGDTIEALSTD